MHKQRNKILSVIARVVLSAGLLVYLFCQIDIQKTKEVLLSGDIRFIVYAFCVYSIIYVILLYRWFTLIRSMKLNTPFLTVVRFHLIGLFGNLFLPTSVGGDFIKILGLCAHTTSKPKVVASVVLDRLVGFIGIFLVGTLALVAGYRLINDPTLIMSILALALLSFVLTFVLFHEKLYSFFCHLLGPFHEIKKNLMEMHYAIAMLKDRRQSIYLTVGYSVAGQLILAVAYYLLAKALHQEMDFIYFLVFIPLICAISSLPSIGGLGVREAGTAFLFTRAGTTAGIAVSISLMIYFFTVIIGLAGAGFFMATRTSGENEVPGVPKGAERELAE